MQYVEIYKLMNDGSQKIVLKCVLEDDTVVFEGENLQIAKNLEQYGIKDYQNKESVLFPKDGLPFLENLKYNLTSGYLNASGVMSTKYIA